MNLDFKHQLVFPMALYVFYMGALIIYNLRVRMAAVKSGSMSGKFFKTYSSEKYEVPERIIVLGRHVDNQFQAPVLFLVTCAILLALDGVNAYAVCFAWLFVLSRFVHSYIHLTSNHVLRRAGAYGTGWLFILSLWTLIVWRTLLSTAGN